MRKLVPELEHRHKGFTDAELHERRMELRQAIEDNLQLLEDLIERLATVKQTTEKAERHLREHMKQKERLERRLKFLQAHTDHHPSTSERIVTFDGRQVARWIIEQALAPARASGVWTGTCISGFRSPEYSTQLCMDMCGAASCPGQCAGASSNHSCPASHTCAEAEGAVDVLDPAGLQRWCLANGAPIIHTLPSDPNHFSRTGQ